MQTSKWIQGIVDCADLVSETLPGIPVVEISGDNRVLIEKHNGVTEYSRERICVKVQYGTIIICGSCMEFIKMTQEHLVITGNIESVTIQRRT